MTFSSFKMVDTDYLDSFSKPDEKRKKTIEEVKYALAEELSSVAVNVDDRPSNFPSIRDLSLHLTALTFAQATDGME
jgi:hypothetical protein